MSTPAIIRSHDVVEEILDTHRDHAQGDEAGYRGYRGHVYRVLNFARVLVPDGDQRDDKLAVAAAFHDLEVFSTLDYLTPSIRAQDAWLGQTGRASWAPELAVVVAEHHRLLARRGDHPLNPLAGITKCAAGSIGRWPADNRVPPCATPVARRRTISSTDPGTGT